MPEKYILKKIYDIRPLDQEGKIDFEWIKKGKREARSKKKKQPNRTKRFQNKKVNLKELQPRWEKEKSTQSTPSKKKAIRKKVKIRKLKPNWKNLTPTTKSLAAGWSRLISGWGKLKPSFGHSLKANFQISAPRINFAYLRPRSSYFSFVTTLLLLAVFIAGFSFLSEAVDFKSQALASSNKAYEEILNARKNLKSLDSEAAKNNFENAYQNFKAVEESGGIISKTAFKLASLSPINNQITAGRKLVKAGQYFSQGGAQLSETLSLVKSIKLSSFLETGSSSNANLGKLLNKSLKNIDQALADFQKANQFAQNTDINQVPTSYQDKVKTLQQSLPELIALLSRQEKYLKLAQTLIGNGEHRRYLIAFQNNSEIRPTGGFIGSYAEITFLNGKLQNLKVDGIYNIDGQLSAQIIPPKPIQKISSGWSTHDANWFFDYPTSAKKIMKFYELTGQGSLDGVISITPRVLREVLKLTGPIELTKYKKTIKAGNFLTVLQQHMEKDYNKKINQPKRILAELTPKIVERLSKLKKGKLQGLLKTGQKMLTEKDILLYSEDKRVQKTIELNGWGGNVIQGSDDYLAVVNANINGYKTDRYLKQTTTLDLNMNSTRKIKHQLKVKREHNGGDKKQSFYNKVNSNYMRVFLPKKVKINSVRGFTPEKIEDPLDYKELGFKKDSLIEEIKTGKSYNPKKGYYTSLQHGKKVIGGWVYTSPGHKTTVEIDYSLKLPESKDKVNLLLQKQPGQDKHTLNLSIKAPGQIQIERGPSELRTRENKATIQTPLKKDELIEWSWK